MKDNELLSAISGMLDQKFNLFSHELRGEMQEIKEDVRVLKGDVEDLKEDVRVLKGDVEGLKEDVHSLKLSNEQIIIPRLNTIEACYTSTFNRYRDSVETYDVIQEDVRVLKRVVAEHSEKLQKIS